MTDQQLAKKIIELSGGVENIASVRHCATRLRLMVNDKDLIKVHEIENLDKIKGSFFNAGQYQIILGTGLVNRIYDEVIKVTGEQAVSSEGEKQEYGNRFQRAIRMFSDVFVPIIPVLVATGLFMGLRGLLTQEAVLGIFGMTPEQVPQNLLLFTQILTDTAFAFLPALVCWSTFRNFGGSPVIGIVLGLMLVSPSLPSAYDIGSGAAEPLRFLGIITVSGYQGSVLPAFVTGIITAKFEKWLRRHVPDAIDLIVTPFITLLVGIMIALFALGPILHSLERVVLVVVEHLLNLPMGIGGLLYGSFGQLLGIFGIHHILNFLEISMLANDGWNYLNPIGTCGNVAQAGAVLAVAIKATNNKTKQVAFPSCLSALLGITEPAVFGVNLKLVTPFVCSMIGGGVGGFLSSLLHLRATGMSITGIPGTLLYLNEQLPFYIITNVVAFAVSFVLTWMIWKEIDNKKKIVSAKDTKGKITEIAAENKTVAEKVDPVIYAPVSGEVIALSEIPDKTFASGMLGDGVGINPSNGKVIAPFDGIISATTETSHAIGVTGKNGAELLIHIGVDTVAMQGKGFKTLVKDGEKVVKGQNLMEFDVDEIKKAGYSDTVAILVGNTSEFAAVKRLDSGKVTAGDQLLSIE